MNNWTFIQWRWEVSVRSKLENSHQQKSRGIESELWRMYEIGAVSFIPIGHTNEWRARESIQMHERPKFVTGEYREREVYLSDEIDEEIDISETREIDRSVTGTDKPPFGLVDQRIHRPKTI